MKKTVLIIPGVMGTELFSHDARRVWPPSVTRFDKDFEHVYLDENGKPRHGDITPGLPFRNVYRKMFDYVEAEGYDVRYFGYDWRLDNDWSAETLQAFIDALPAGPLSIIAHSMGGLVATRYMKRTGARKVEKFIAIGTPFQGAVGALKDLELGTFMGDGFTGQISKKYFLVLLRNQISWYQILPSRSFFDTRPEGCITEDGRRIRGFEDTRRFIESRKCVNRKALASGVAFGDALDPLAALERTDPWFIAGTGHPTVDGIEYLSGEQERIVCELTDRGDGSVLLSSATMGGGAEMRYPGHVHTFAETHSGMFSNPAVLERIVSILEME